MVKKFKNCTKGLGPKFIDWEINIFEKRLREAYPRIVPLIDLRQPYEEHKLVKSLKSHSVIQRLIDQGKAKRVLEGIYSYIPQRGD